MAVQPGVHVLSDLIDATTLTVTLIGDEAGGLIVDTGLTTTPNAVVFPYFAHRGWPRTWLKTIVHTHCHADHVAGNAALLATSDARVFIHQSEVAYLAEPRAFVDMLQSIHAEEPEPSPDADEVRRQYGPGTPGADGLVDGDTIATGDRTWRVVHTPGHSDGGICLYDAASGTLITGDAIQAEGTTSCDLAFYFDADDYARALDTVDALDVETLIAGHPFKPFESAYLTGPDARRLLAVSRRAHQRYDEQVTEILSNARDPLTTKAVAQHLVTMNGFDRLVGSAVTTTRAHLRRLQRLGTAVCLPEDGQSPRRWERL